MLLALLRFNAWHVLYPEFIDNVIFYKLQGVSMVNQIVGSI
jgi:hypothetical protein